MKIYITGCAKSGTTLLARLMHAFDGIQHLNEEVTLTDFVGMPCKTNCLLGKRSEFTVFSQILKKDEKERQLELITKHDIKIINVVRDGRDVVKSFYDDWGYWNPLIWIDAIDQMKEYPQYISSTIWYEDIVNKPNMVQYALMKHFNLDKVHRFTDYPKFTPGYSYASKKKNYKQRKINTGSTNKDKNFYKKRPNDIEYFDKQLKHLGYDV